MFINDDLLIYAAATALIEVPLFFLCGYRSLKDLILFAAVNLISNLLLNDFLSTVAQDSLIIFLFELTVLILEFVLCSYWIKPSAKLLKVLIFTNAASYFIGVIYFTFK